MSNSCKMLLVDNTIGRENLLLLRAFVHKQLVVVAQLFFLDATASGRLRQQSAASAGGANLSSQSILQALQPCKLFFCFGVLLAYNLFSVLISIDAFLN